MNPPARVVGDVTAAAGLSRRERRLRFAALLVLLGMAIEAASFLTVHPLAFLLYLGLGGLAIVAGVAEYLFSLLDSDRSQHPPA
jgi:hypothetical protein